MNELCSLMNHGQSIVYLWLLSQGFNNLANNRAYWSSSTDGKDTVESWVKSSNDGNIGSPQDKITNSFYVIAVRGGL